MHEFQDSSAALKHRAVSEDVTNGLIQALSWYLFNRRIQEELSCAKGSCPRFKLRHHSPAVSQSMVCGLHSYMEDPKAAFAGRFHSTHRHNVSFDLTYKESPTRERAGNVMHVWELEALTSDCSLISVGPLSEDIEA
jgi:hypothetical protein